MCRRGAGRAFVSNGGIAGSVGTGSSPGAPVPGLEEYSGKVVIVVCLDKGASEGVLAPSRSGKVGCLLKSLALPSLNAWASCLALISFSFLSALSVFVLTILSIRRLILVLQ